MFTVWTKRRYSSDEKVGEFQKIEEAEAFASLLHKGNAGSIHVWITGVIKDYAANVEQ